MKDFELGLKEVQTELVEITDEVTAELRKDKELVRISLIAARAKLELLEKDFEDYSWK